MINISKHSLKAIKSFRSFRSIGKQLMPGVTIDDLFHEITELKDEVVVARGEVLIERRARLKGEIEASELICKIEAEVERLDDLLSRAEFPDGE